MSLLVAVSIRRVTDKINVIASRIRNDLHVILVALSSNFEIDPEKFQQFCSNLAAKYVEKYEWFHMSVTLHKILSHGSQIIKSSPLPIGMLSEQASESRNKFWRYDREHHTRKLNRKTTVLDLFHRALESSDPFLSMISLRNRQKNNKRLVLSEKVLSLLKPSSINVLNHGELAHLAQDSIEETDDDANENVILRSEEIIVSSEEN